MSRLQLNCFRWSETKTVSDFCRCGFLLDFYYIYNRKCTDNGKSENDLIYVSKKLIGCIRAKKRFFRKQKNRKDKMVLRNYKIIKTNIKTFRFRSK